MSVEAALKAATTHTHDFLTPYVRDLGSIIDIDAIRSAGIRMGVDPLGGASVHYWQPIAELYKLDITVVNRKVDPTFSFMTVDHDGKIRMDCSSPYAMANLVGLKDRFQIAFGNDPDSDRHGIVTPSAGLMNPNHYLAVAIRYLLTHRPQWPASAAVGKTLVSSSLIDRVVAVAGPQAQRGAGRLQMVRPGIVRRLDLFRRRGERRRSFLRRDGTVWTTDKDGPIMDLLAAEITARTGKDPGQHFQELTATIRHAVLHPHRRRRHASPESGVKKLSPEAVTAPRAGGRTDHGQTDARARQRTPTIGGLKVVAASGWFAARPSGTENIYKIYAESFKDQAHLDAIVREAQVIVGQALAAS